MSSRFSSEDIVQTKERKDAESPIMMRITHKCTPGSNADYGCTSKETLLPFALLSLGKHDQLKEIVIHSEGDREGMAPHSSVLAWRIPGKAEPGGLPSLGSHRVGHD